MSLPTVIIPVFNAYELLRACLDSVTRTVPPGTEVLVIDDASTDGRVKPFLQTWVGQGTARQLVLQPENRGFVATANQGMHLTGKDLVLLNSDTEVTEGWLQNLADCLNSDETIATATPWSNNGEIVSIPAFCQPNPVPGDPDAIARQIKSCGAPVFPNIPTAVGFCMAISRRAIDRVGVFDEATFGRGYGEENDFCMRAEQEGMRNVLCDDTYVVHHGGASFGPLGLKPNDESMQRLLAKHPGYLDKVMAFIGADPLAARRNQILECLERTGVGMR